MPKQNKIQDLHELLKIREKQTRIWKRLELDIRKKKTEYEKVLFQLRVKQLQLDHAKLILTNQVQTVEGLVFQKPQKGVLSYDHLSFYRGLTKLRFQPEVIADILCNIPSKVNSDPLAKAVQGKETQLAAFLIQGLYASPSTQEYLSQLLRHMLRVQLEHSTSLAAIPHILTELLRCVTIQCGRTFVELALLKPLQNITSEPNLVLDFEHFEIAEPWCMQILESCISSLLELPQVVVSIVQELILCGKKMPQNENSPLSPTHCLLVEFLFLHWLVQALVTPEGVGIFLFHPVSQTSRFNLQVLGTILLKVCCSLTGSQRSSNPVLERIGQNILPKLQKKLEQVECWFAPTNDEEFTGSLEEDQFYGMMVVNNNHLRMFHHVLQLSPRTPQKWKEYVKKMRLCDATDGNAPVFVSLDCSPMMNEHLTGPKFEDMRERLSKGEDEFRHMLRSALMTMDRVPNAGSGSFAELLQNLSERKSLQRRETMVMFETLQQVGKNKNWNLDKMLNEMVNDEEAIVKTLKSGDLNLPHQVLDLLSVDIRTLFKLTESTERILFNVLIQEVLTFIQPEIPNFLKRMTKILQIMSKNEGEEEEEMYSLVEDRFVSRRTARLMSKMRNELIRFLNTFGISRCQQNSKFMTLPALNFGNEYVALTLQDYVLQQLGPNFWISGLSDHAFNGYLTDLNEHFTDYKHFFEFVDRRNPPQITSTTVKLIIEDLKEMSNTSQCGFKVKVLRRCRDSLSSVLALYPHTSSDDYLPFFCYIVMRANIPNFLSQMHYIKIVSQRKTMEKVFVDCIVAVKYLLSFPTDKLNKVEEKPEKAIYQPVASIKNPSLESETSEENAASSPSTSTLTKLQPLTNEIYKPATVVEAEPETPPTIPKSENSDDSSPPQQLEQPFSFPNAPPADVATAEVGKAVEKVIKTVTPAPTHPSVHEFEKEEVQAPSTSIPNTENPVLENYL